MQVEVNVKQLPSTIDRGRGHWVTAAALALALGVPSLQASSPAREAARRDISVLEIRLPRLAWNTNLATLSLRNEGQEPRPIRVTIRSESQVGGGRVDWTTEHVLAPARETTIDREFMIKPLPGGVSLRLTIDAGDESRPLFSGEYVVDFPISNDRINPLSATPKHDGKSYPRLVLRNHGPFAFYFVEGDSFAETHVEELAERRERAYRGLVERINPAFDGRVAFFLYPDAETKRAYTFHRGEGWSVGKLAIAEIFDASHELDPYHELAHVVVGSLGTPPAMFDEGLATYMQEGEVWLGHTIDSWAKTLGDRGKLFPLAEIFAFADIGSVETCALVSYPQSGSVVKFLTRLAGWPAMQRALRELRNSDDPSVVSANRELFQAIFGLELAEAERQWLESLDSAEVEAVPAARIDAIECR